jgi:hypothetical protein
VRSYAMQMEALKRYRTGGFRGNSSFCVTRFGSVAYWDLFVERDNAQPNSSSRAALVG